MALFEFILLVLLAPPLVDFATADLPLMDCAPWCLPDLCFTVPNKTESFQISCLEGEVGALRSNYVYYHGVFSAFIQMSPGYIGGTCTAFYLVSDTSGSNENSDHFEIDMELYGGDNGTDVVAATNVFFGGKQNLAQFRLPFDASASYHKFTIMWNYQNVTWFVDDNPIRIVQKAADKPWPEQALRPMMTQWTINYGDKKPDFSHGPIPAFGQNFTLEGCRYDKADPQIYGDCPSWTGLDLAWSQPLTAAQASNLDQTNYGWANNNTRINDWGWDNA